MRVKVCVCVCITIKCVVYKHERQKVKRYYPDDLIAKRIEREKEKSAKEVPRENKRSTHKHLCLPEREKREKSETTTLPKNSFFLFCAS